jgi:nucleotide-binding universal stress UspA family protein
MSFRNVVCGIDGSPEGEVALAQAIRLLDPGGRLVALTAYDPAIAIHGGYEAGRLIDQLQADADEIAAGARASLAGRPGVEVTVRPGRAAVALLAAAEEERADLLAVGTHGYSRTAGILLGTATTTVLHDARCNVLIARASAAPDRFPATVVVGIDGSPPSERAATLARALGERFGCDVRVVAATGGKGLDVEAAERIAPGIEIDPRRPLEVLVECSRSSDLLVVGSRGLHGLRALGSLSERVAHEAGCSVLVVRPA